MHPALFHVHHLSDSHNPNTGNTGQVRLNEVKGDGVSPESVDGDEDDDDNGDGDDGNDDSDDDVVMVVMMVMTVVMMAANDMHI